MGVGKVIVVVMTSPLWGLLFDRLATEEEELSETM